MSGKRHHFIPQFLLKGFACTVVGKNSYCWLYRSASGPFKANTKNIAAEGSFYESENVQEIDDKITEEEPRYAALIGEYRSSISSNEILPSDTITDLITHLTISTRHVRQSFSYIGDTLLRDFLQLLGTPGDLERMILKYIENNPGFIRKSLEEEFERRGLDHGAQSHLLDNLERLAKTNAGKLVKTGSVQNHKDLIQAIYTAKLSMPGNACAGHLRALNNSVSPEARRAQLAGFQWRKITFPNHSLTLGDVVSWGTLRDNHSPISLLWSGEPISSIFLPISHRHLIYGTNCDRQLPGEVGFINRSGAILSSEFMVSSIKSAERSDDQKLLGSGYNTFIDSKLSQVRREIKNELF